MGPSGRRGGPEPRLDRSVLAEGIETITQAQVLHGLGYDSGQGYLFGKPLPLDEHNAKPTETGAPA